MMSTAPITIDELLESFEDLTEWDERYGFLIELGAELPEMDEALKIGTHIAIMESGRIVERGTPRQLMQSSGTYRRLHELQFEQE